jgi:hypothetical protein
MTAEAWEAEKQRCELQGVEEGSLAQVRCAAAKPSLRYVHVAIETAENPPFSLKLYKFT